MTLSFFTAMPMIAAAYLAIYAAAGLIRERSESPPRGRAAILARDARNDPGPRDLHVRLGTPCWRCGAVHRTAAGWSFCEQTWPMGDRGA